MEHLLGNETPAARRWLSGVARGIFVRKRVQVATDLPVVFELTSSGVPIDRLLLNFGFPDDSGNVVCGRRTPPAGAVINYGYSYDALNRLTQVTNGNAAQQEAYAYDALGNRISKSVGQTNPSITSYGFDAANQLVEMRNGSLTGTPNLTYDNAGNLLSDGTRVYTWDALNQLSQVASGATTVTYAYDGSGRRVKKVVGGVTTQWLYDGEDIHSEYGSTWTNPNAVYAWAGLDHPLTRSVVTGSATYGQTLYYAADGLGSIIGATNSTDTSLQTQRFDAWGNMLASSGNAIPQYGYTGREPDETGIVYYRARYYDPALGRFVSRDPIGLAGGINPYSYVGNNPVNFVDPTGLVDIIYSPGPLGSSNPIVANPRAPGQNYLVAGPRGETMPMGAGIYQRTVVGGKSIDQVFDVVQTSNLVDWGRSYIQNTRLNGATGNAGYSEVWRQSGQGQPWDTKQFLPFQSAYFINGKAELNDYVGNAIWGTALNALGISEIEARLGAQTQAILQNARSLFRNGAFDDPRDQEAIGFGYTLPLSAGSAGGNASSTLGGAGNQTLQVVSPSK